MTDATGKLARGRLRLSESVFEEFYRDGVKPQALNALSRMSTTGVDESLFEDDGPVLTISEANPEREKAKTEAKFWRRLPSNEGLDTFKPALPY